MSEPHYKIKNWERFQHYHKPRPAWIKLHRSLLDDKDFQSLSTRSRALLVMLWLIAAESDDGTLPDDGAIAWRLRLPTREIAVDIQTLGHYLERIYTDSRVGLASEEKRREEREGALEPALEAVPTPKVAFAPRVYMTESEHSKLVEKYGAEAVAWMVERLDAWKEGKGKGPPRGNESDSGKIRSWVVAAWEEHLAKNRSGYNASPRN